MSPALNGSSAIRRFKHSIVIEMHAGINFDFYTGLRQVVPFNKRMRTCHMRFCMEDRLHSVYLGRYSPHLHHECSQAFPLHFRILQVIKKRLMGKPGNKARYDGS